MNWADVGITAGRWALVNSGGAAVIAILVLLVQKLLGDRISPRWRHNLWLLIVVRLMLPTLPGIHLPLPHWPHQIAKANPVIVPTELPNELRPAPTAPIHKLHGSDDTPVADSAQFQPDVIERPNSVAAPVVDNEIVISSAQPPVAADNVSPKPLVATGKFQRPAVPPMRVIIASLRWRTWALLIWLAGAIVVAGWFIFTTIRLQLVTRRLTPVDDEISLCLLDQCSQLIGLKRPPILVSGPADFGPALIGIFRPRLVIPRNILASFSQHELRSILLHELIHHRRRDVAVNYLLAALTSIHWFNPLVWFAFSRLRAERELACDQAVMNLSPPRERLAYGCTILKLLELAGRGPLVPTAVGVIGKKGLMQRRIAMIARFDRRQPARPLVAVALSILLGGAALTAPTFAQDRPGAVPALPPTQAPPAVDQARQAVEAAAQPQVPAGAPPVIDPAAPPPTQPPAPRGIEIPAPAPGANPFQPQPVTQPPLPILPGHSVDAFANSPRSIEDASASAANAKTMERLKITHPLASSGMPLREVLGQIANFGKLDIVTDDQAISNAGADLNAPINMTINEPRPLEQLLEMSLRLAGPQIDYSVLNGVIFVSSREQLSSRIVTRVYDIGNADHDAITDLLTNGTGLVPRVSFVGNKLVITASELTQRHIAKLLSAVSDQMSQHRVGQASRGPGVQDTTVYSLRFTDPQSVKPVLESACSPNVRVFVDGRTNSIIITGGPDDQKVASAIIAKLDQRVGDKPPPQSAEETLLKLRALAETALKAYERYGANSKQVETIGKQIDSLGNEASKWIDQLAKDGNLPAAEKLRDELSQIKDLLAPLAREVQGNHPPEAAR
jgi:beta-lactamase regulating signal transducer with metallopeptidase domain